MDRAELLLRRMRQSRPPSPYNTVSAIPSSFFIDSEGKIKLGTTGLISLDEIKAILQAE